MTALFYEKNQNYIKKAESYWLRLNKNDVLDYNKKS